MKNWAKGIGGAIMSFAFVFGVTVAAGTLAEAQYRHSSGQYRHRDRDRDNDRTRWEWRRRRNEDLNRYRRDRRYDNNGRYGAYGNYGGYGRNNNVNQIELNRGYQAGLNTGARDAQRGQSYSPQRSHYYREARTQAFLNGFVRGYDQGYRQYAGYRNGQYRRNNRNGIGGILGGIFRP